MLKHVHISPLRSRSDSISLRSSTTFSTSSSCASSLCGSPEPPGDSATPSRSSSYSSLTESIPQVNNKIISVTLPSHDEREKSFSSWKAKLKLNFLLLLKSIKTFPLRLAAEQFIFIQNLITKFRNWVLMSVIIAIVTTLNCCLESALIVFKWNLRRLKLTTEKETCALLDFQFVFMILWIHYKILSLHF